MRFQPKGATDYESVLKIQTNRDGRILQVGHKVLFLTTGKFKSTGGTVVRICKTDKDFAVIVDSATSKIRRKPYNLRIVD